MSIRPVILLLVVVALLGLPTVSNASPSSPPDGITGWHVAPGDSIIIEAQHDESVLKTVKIKNYSDSGQFSSTAIRVRRKNRGDLHWGEWVTVSTGSTHTFSDVANATYFEVEDVDAADGAANGSVIVK